MEWKAFDIPPKDRQKILYFDKDIDGKIASGYYRNGKVIDESFQQVMHGATMWADLPEIPSMNRGK